IGFLEAPMSVYRLHAAGIWTKNSPVEKLRTQLDLIPDYDALTQYVFHEDFDLLANRLRQSMAASQIGNIADFVAGPAGDFLPVLLDWMPAVLVSAARAIVPPALKRFIVRKLRRNRAV
ncbi:MAG: hypothetical protein PHG30_09965, partial [Eubacteriales bacterium]|nr:hypothetical protein [Eubacteriales bacterium]